VGAAAAGLPGAVAATLGLVAVSLGAVGLTRLVPDSWFHHPRVRGALAGVPAYTAALGFFLAYRMAHAGDFSHPVPAAVLVAAVAAGRLHKLSPVWLMLGAVGVGILLW